MCSHLDEFYWINVSVSKFPELPIKKWSNTGPSWPSLNIKVLNSTSASQPKLLMTLRRRLLKILWEKEKMLVTSYPQCFQKASSSGLLKVGIVWSRGKLHINGSFGLR